jgi:hypothetical protein
MRSHTVFHGLGEVCARRVVGGVKLVAAVPAAIDGVEQDAVRVLVPGVGR